MNPRLIKSPFNSLLKRNYKHYYAQNSAGVWEEVDRLTCISYDPATAFNGKFPQRWYCYFKKDEADYIVRLARDKAGEKLYNAAKYLHRKENKELAEQYGCIGNDCPNCKGWDKIVDGISKCDNCPNKVSFVALDKNWNSDEFSHLDLDSGIDVNRQYESSYLLETLHSVLSGLSDEERRLWECLVSEMKQKDIALLFGWTDDKLSYRKKLLFDKLRHSKPLKEFFENS